MEIQRYPSLDIFRGITVAFMILVNNPGSWMAIYPLLGHATWNGYTPTDLVFPFFLFAVGNSLAFVWHKFQVKDTKPSAFLQKALKRSILIFIIGLVLNWSPFVQWQEDTLVIKSLENLRIFGVLQRIALVYLFAALVIYFLKKSSYILLFSIIILLGYYLLALLFGTGPDPFSMQSYFGTQLDLWLLGPSHLYHGEGVAFDPEGVASTLPAIISVLFGYLAGHTIIKKGSQLPLEKLVFIGFLLIIMGGLWGTIFPINKKIWSSSFVLLSSGWAVLLLGFLISIVEKRKWVGKWTSFFEVFGKNALFIFFLSGFLPRVLALFNIGAANETPLTYFYHRFIQPIFSNEKNSSLVYALLFLSLMWLIAYQLDQKKIYIKV